MAEKNTYENIHQFLSGELSDEEKKAFVQEMGDNDALKNKLEMEKNMLHTLELAGDTELRETISAVHNSLKKQRFFEPQNEKREAVVVDMKKKRTANRMLYALAAVLLLVIATWFVFSDNIPSDKANAIYANHYKTEKTITNRLLNEIGQAHSGQLETREEKLGYALDQFRLGAFENAKKYFRELNAEYPTDQLVAFYMGLCEMETGNFQTAVGLLKTANSDGFAYQDAAEWYLALGHLKNGQTTEATRLFKKIAADQNSVFQEKAAGVLKEIK